MTTLSTSVPLQQTVDARKSLEMLAMEKARTRLIPFSMATSDSYQPNWHHYLIAEKLEKIERREIQRLMIFVPPRHGKSELSSIRFPAWYLGKHPDHEIIACSYAIDLALDFGRKTRNVTQESIYKEIFPDFEMAEDSSASKRWNTSRGGGYIASGVGGPVTGRGADVLIIDDPVKNAEEAYSPVINSRNWDWYITTARTRLNSNGATIVIMTRWSMDDLAARILEEAEQKGEKWEILHLLAIAEEDERFRKKGEALWPEKFPVSQLVTHQSSSKTWQSLYQGRPRAQEGRLMKREWFEIVPFADRQIVARVRWWDMAATEKKKGKDPDWTVGCLMSKSKAGIYYIENIVRTQATPQFTEMLIKQTAITDPDGTIICMEQEPGSSGVTVIDHYIRVVLPGFPFYGLKSTGSKEVRAMPFSSMAEAGNVKLVHGLWNLDFLNEIDFFGEVGFHDDQADAASGAFSKLAVVEVAGFTEIAAVSEKVYGDPNYMPTGLGGLMQKEF